MKVYNLQDLTIKRVVRIHNRFLRNKFEEKTEQLIDISNNFYKKYLDYLFYGQDPTAPNEIFRIIEDGFRSPAEASMSNLPAYAPLVNSMLGADLARIIYSNKNSQIQIPNYLKQLIGSQNKNI